MFKAKYNCILWVCVFFITSKGNIRAGFSASDCVLPFSCAVVPSVVGFLYSYKQVKYIEKGEFYLPSKEKFFCIFSASMTPLSLYVFLNRKSHNVAMLSLCMVGGIMGGIFALRSVKRKIKDKITEIIGCNNFEKKEQESDMPNETLMNFFSTHLFAVVNCYKNDTEFLLRIGKKLTTIMEDFQNNTKFSTTDYMHQYSAVFKNIAVLIKDNNQYNLFKDVSACKMDLLNVLNKIVKFNSPDEKAFEYYFNIIKQMHNEANSADYVEKSKNFIHEMIRLLLQYNHYGNYDKCEKVQKLFNLFKDPSNKDIFDRKRFEVQMKDAIATVFGYNKKYSYNDYIQYYDMVKYLAENELDDEDNKKFVAGCKVGIIYKSFDRFIFENNCSNDGLSLDEKVRLIVHAPLLEDHDRSQCLSKLMNTEKDKFLKSDLDGNTVKKYFKNLKEIFVLLSNNEKYKEQKKLIGSNILNIITDLIEKLKNNKITFCDELTISKEQNKLNLLCVILNMCYEEGEYKDILTKEDMKNAEELVKDQFFVELDEKNDYIKNLLTQYYKENDLLKNTVNAEKLNIYLTAIVVIIDMFNLSERCKIRGLVSKHINKFFESIQKDNDQENKFDFEKWYYIAYVISIKRDSALNHTEEYLVYEECRESFKKLLIDKIQKDVQSKIDTIKGHSILKKIEYLSENYLNNYLLINEIQKIINDAKFDKQIKNIFTNQIISIISLNDISNIYDCSIILENSRGSIIMNNKDVQDAIENKIITFAKDSFIKQENLNALLSDYKKFEKLYPNNIKIQDNFNASIGLLFKALSHSNPETWREFVKKNNGKMFDSSNIEDNRMTLWNDFLNYFFFKEPKEIISEENKVLFKEKTLLLMQNCVSGIETVQDFLRINATRHLFTPFSMRYSESNMGPEFLKKLHTIFYSKFKELIFVGKIDDSKEALNNICKRFFDDYLSKEQKYYMTSYYSFLNDDNNKAEFIDKIKELYIKAYPNNQSNEPKDNEKNIFEYKEGIIEFINTIKRKDLKEKKKEEMSTIFGIEKK